MRRANSSGLHIAPLPAEDGGDEEALETGKHHKVLEAGKGFTAPESAPFANEWAPSCSARRLRSLRRLLFSQTKVLFWESILKPPQVQQRSTKTSTRIREIRTLDINRVMATKECFVSSLQTCGTARNRPYSDYIWRRATGIIVRIVALHLGKGHGGQRRAFKVQFRERVSMTMGVRNIVPLQASVDEIQMDQFAARVEGRERGLLLVPCQNRAL